MRAAAGALDELDANLRECRIREHGAQHSNRAPGERARALSLNTRQTLVIIPLLPGSSAQHVSATGFELLTSVCVCVCVCVCVYGQEVWFEKRALPPMAISTWVSELICAAAATTFKKGSFHHFSPMR